MVKGIILAGGRSTRLFPATQTICKQLLPVYDRPMVYYPLSTLMLAGIKDILIITNPHEKHLFEKLLGDGKSLGISIEYAVQDKPRGIPDAFKIGEKFIGEDNVCLILGDNIFYGQGLSKMLQRIHSFSNQVEAATIFGYTVKDPERYGVIEFDEGYKVLSIEEKPLSPKSNTAAVGLYFYPNSVIQLAKSLKPSARGETEISELNSLYLQRDQLMVEVMTRGYSWLDTGTHTSMIEASNFIKIIEDRQGLKIGCIEEVAYRMGYIDKKQLKALAQPLMSSGYGEYLLSIV